MAKPSFPARISRQQVFYSILLSYLIMLVIPTVMSVFGYVYSSQMLHKEALAVQQGLLEQVKLQLDQRIQRIYDYNEQVASNAQLLRVATYDESADGQKLFDYVDTQALVRSPTTALPRNHDAMVYLRRSNSFITATRRYRSELLDAYADQLGMSPDGLLALVHSTEYRGYTLLHTATQHTIAFTRTIYADISREPLGKVITFMPMKDLSAALGELVWADQSAAAILSPQGLVAAGGSADASAFPAYGALPVDGSLLYQDMDGVPHVLASIASSTADWRYCVSIPTHVFTRNLSIYRLVLAIEIGLCILLGILLAIWLSRAQYGPIKRLQDILTYNAHHTDKAEQGTYRALEAALESLVKDHASLQAQARQDEMVRRRVLFTSLLKQRTEGPEAFEAVYACYGVALRQAPCAVVTLSLQHVERSTFMDAGQADVPYDLIFFSLDNVLNEVLQAGWLHIADECDGMMVCALQPKDGKSWDSLRDDLQRVEDFFADGLHLALGISVSQQGSSPGELPELYLQTLEAHAHKAFWGDEAPDILFYSELSGGEETPSAGGERFALSLQLLNCLTTRSYEAAYALLQEVLADAFVMDVRHLQMNKCRMFAMVSNILGVLGNMETEQDLAFFAALNPYDRLLSVQTVGALREATDAIFLEIIAYSAQKAEDTPAWVEKARAYIGEHYADAALSVGTVAEAFGMNVSHFSRTFKKHTGIGILDYIHQTRLKAAKALLAQGRTVVETAEATGYIDSKALIRAFKRYEGITPGQYKA